MDPNFRQYGDTYNPDNYYNNTYSLWQNSRYYDTNNLSPQNYNSNQWTTNKECVEEPIAVKKDAKNRRIITRMALYEDPEHFYEKNYPQPDTLGFDWTKHNWTKASEMTQDTPGTSSENQPGSMTQYQKKNRIEQNLEKMLKQPVKLNKAESMMQKMGWQGGALGKSGSGIVEPIKPNANYAIKSRGLGQRNVPRVKKMRAIDNNKNTFTTNVLLFILEFVKDDMESELLFESCLWKEERKWVHTIVNDVINADGMLDCDAVGHMDIVNEIYEHNCFVLATQSEGKAPNRQLCVFKEAPPNMYLITPSDLRDEPEVLDEMETEATDEAVKNTESTESKDTNKTVKETNIDTASKTANVQETDTMDVENPFMMSITRNLTKEDDKITDKLQDCTLKDVSDVYKKIVDYFIEFSEQDNFTEMRFLGSFVESEVYDINRFFDDAKKCVEGNFEGANDEMVGVFRNMKFDVHEDVNGFTVLYRIQNTS